MKSDSVFKMLVDGKTAASVIAATVWGALAVAGSPDKATALIILSVIAVGCIFAMYVINHNKTQDSKLAEAESGRDDCRDQLRQRDIAITFLHTKFSKNGRRNADHMPPLEELLGADAAKVAMQQMSERFSEFTGPERRVPHSRRKRAKKQGVSHG